MEQPSVAEKAPLTTAVCLSYVAPHIATMMLIMPMGLIQGIYAKYYGLSLTTIAGIIFVSKIFDTLTDPLIGYWADRYYNRHGTRKPFMLVGGLLFIVCGYFLYVPPEEVSAGYFAAWFIAIYLAWTLFEVPHVAWASELASSSAEKSKIYSFRAASSYAAMALFYMVPLLPYFETTDITPQTLKVVALAAGLSMLPLLYIGLKYTPDNPVQPVSQTVKPTGEWRLLLKLFLSNKPFLIFISANLCILFSAGMWFSLIFTYVDAYLNMGEQYARCLCWLLWWGCWRCLSGTKSL